MKTLNVTVIREVVSQCRFHAESVPSLQLEPVSAQIVWLASTARKRERVVARAARQAVLRRATGHHRALIASSAVTSQHKGSRHAMRVQLGSTASRKAIVRAQAVHREALVTVMGHLCVLSATLVHTNLAQDSLIAKCVLKANLRTRPGGHCMLGGAKPEKLPRRFNKHRPGGRDKLSKSGHCQGS